MAHGARYRYGRSVAAAVALMVVAGSAAGQPPDAFEARCAQLPSSRVGVTTVPIAYGEDETLSIDQLNLRSGHTPGLHLTFGLTTAKFASHVTVEIHLFENRDGTRACGTLGVDVELSARPMVIYLAQELDGSPCARTATMEHEMKHVAVFRAVLDEAARDLAADLAADDRHGRAMGEEQSRAATADERTGDRLPCRVHGSARARVERAARTASIRRRNMPA